MGFSSDKMAAMFGVSRQEQNEFAVRSHTTATKAHEEVYYDRKVVPYKGSTKENGVKSDSKIEKISKMKPAFIKPHGTHTAANSSFLSYGASASLLMSEEHLLDIGLKPLAYFVIGPSRHVIPFKNCYLTRRIPPKKFWGEMALIWKWTLVFLKFMKLLLDRLFRIPLT